MAKDVERLENDIKKIEERLRRIETAVAIHGLKVGAITLLLVTFFSSIGAIVSHKIASIAKWWTGQ